MSEVKETKEFVPTHKLIHNYPALNLKAGTLMRKINPLVGEQPNDIARCLTKEDFDVNCSNPWLFCNSDLEALPEWPTIKQQMQEEILKQKQ